MALSARGGLMKAAYLFQMEALGTRGRLWEILR